MENVFLEFWRIHFIIDRDREYQSPEPESSEAEDTKMNCGRDGRTYVWEKGDRVSYYRST